MLLHGGHLGATDWQRRRSIAVTSDRTLPGRAPHPHREAALSRAPSTLPQPRARASSTPPPRGSRSTRAVFAVIAERVEGGRWDRAFAIATRPLRAPIPIEEHDLARLSRQAPAQRPRALHTAESTADYHDSCCCSTHHAEALFEELCQHGRIDDSGAISQKPTIMTAYGDRVWG